MVEGNCVNEFERLTNEGTAENSETVSVVYPLEFETAVLPWTEDRSEIAGLEVRRKIVYFHDVTEFFVRHVYRSTEGFVVVPRRFYGHLADRCSKLFDKFE